MIKWIALGAIAALVLLFIFLPVVAWILVGLVLLIIAVVLLVPIGADVAWIDGKFSLAARVDGFALQLYPRKPRDPNKPPKEKKPKEEKPKEEQEPKEQTGGKRRLNLNKDEILELLKKAIKALGKFGKITVRRFMLHFTAAGDDPYNVAMLYNDVNAALSILAPICVNTFNVTGKTDVWTQTDFTLDCMKLDFALSLTIRLLQVVRVGIVLAFGALGVLLRSRRRQKEEAKQALSEGVADIEEQNTESTIDTTKAEERKDAHE